MRNHPTSKSLRRKLSANSVWSFSLALCLLWLALSFNGIFAQNTSQPVAPPKSAGLPRAFAQFSAGDVLKQIFDGYDPKTGRVAGIHDLEKKPALVEINKAALWKAQGQDYLVVLVDVPGDDNGLCGNCSTYSFLAVLKKVGNALSLVAKQLTLPSQDAPVEYESLDENQFIQYTGHDDVALDLAPYKLDSRETLIGVRLEHMWLPALDWSTSLALYRIEDGRVREVFREPVVERNYQETQGAGAKAVEKTTSTISFPSINQPAGQKFNDLIINKITVRCPIKETDEDCNSKQEGFRQVKTQFELWRFDGQRYAKIKPVKR